MPTDGLSQPGGAATCALAQRNIEFLAQARALLESLSDADFVAPGPGGLRGGVGPHLRHVLDHYELLLEGIATQTVDYDVRARNTPAESDRRLALERLAGIARRLADMGEVDAARALVVKVDSGEAGARCEGASSVGRELQFLVSHTVHHFAVIAVLLRVRGIDPGRDFGVAPSTLKHEVETGACAR